MNRFLKKSTALALSTVLALQVIPTAALAAAYEEQAAQLPEVLTLDGDGYIKVTASKENGGFLIDTKAGDKLSQTDDNKFLLFPDEYYNTSFTSFRITDEAGEVRDVIFGREYGFLGLDSEMISVTANGAQISSVWRLEDLEFTQTLTVLNTESDYHGMIGISYGVKNNGTEDCDIEARILLDTALGYQDYGYYELTSAGGYQQVTYECLLDNTDEAAYKNLFFAYNNPYSPTVRAYTVNDDGSIPTQVAIGHWSNLSGTVFDFVPNETMNFTNTYNVEHLTADSAYALYYDMGSVAANGSSTVSTNYGIYSNVTANLGDVVSLNITEAPPNMVIPKDADLSQENVMYEQDGRFEISFQLENLSDMDIEGAELRIIPETNVDVLDETGAVVTYDKSTMYPRYYAFEADKINAHGNGAYTIPLQATPAAPTYYRQIDVAVVVDDQTISTKSVYVYCPGTGSGSIGVTATSPSIVYREGSQTLMVSGSGFGGLSNKGAYSVVLTSRVSGQSITVDPTGMDINVEENVMTLPFSTTEPMTLGDWDITINWTDPAVEDICTNAMTFSVTDDQKYIANSYGIITIEREGTTGDARNQYFIRAYNDENAYIDAWKYDGPASGEESLVVLEFRGIFTVTKDDEGNITKVNGLSNKTVNGAIQNTMTISNCLDVEEGTLVLTDEEDNIDIDINAKLYTTGARTAVWNGVCAITSFEDGGANELIQYDYNGEAVGDIENNVADSNAITLIWPSSAETFQTIGGVLMELRYGQFGQLATEPSEEVTAHSERVRVLAFGAQMSTDMLIPSNIPITKREKSSLETQYQTMANNPSGYTGDELRKTFDDYSNAQDRFENAANGTLGLYVHDVLFGGGFIGFNCSIEVGLPSYFDGMPTIEGVLNLKVINEEWGFGVEGSADMGAFMMEGSLKLRSYNGIPVPDELYFFVGGFTPGINPDCHGIFWIRGAGGGVSELYETIFPVSSIPPITLMLSGQFAIFQTMTARADLSISLRGYTVEMSEIGIAMGTSTLEIFERIALECYWYPELHIYGGININVMDTILGTGYLVLEEDKRDGSYFYEGYAGCSLQVPESIFLIGGTQLGSVGVGFNDERMFGAAQVLKVDFGVVYEWGNEVEFRFGKYDVVGPTYEGYAANAAPMLLMSNEPMAVAIANVNSKSNVVSVGSYNDGNDYIVSVTYVATSEAEARAIAETMTVTNGGANMADTWVWADEHTNTSDADAMFRCEEEEGVYKATATFSVTQQDYFGKDWTVTTSADSVVEAFAIARMADLKTATLAGETVTLTGDMDQFDRISVYAVEESGMRYLLAETDAPNATENDTCALMFDEAYLKVLPTGEYTIEAMARTINQTSNPIIQTDDKFEYTNAQQPTAPQVNSVELGGDYTLDLDLGTTTADGYVATVYEQDGDDWKATDFSSMYLDPAETLTLGGQFTQTLDTQDGDAQTVTTGLVADKTYRVGLKTYNNLDDDQVMKSVETFSESITMKAPVKTQLDFTIPDSVALVSPTSIDSTVAYDTVATGDVTIDISSNTQIGNAKYKLDGGEFVTMTQFGSLAFAGLETGIHRLSILGENDGGDAFMADYVFVVDTVAPKLSLSTYGGGGFYTGDSITVTGLTDAEVTLVVTVEGEAVTPISQSVDGNGNFSVTIPLAEDMAYQYVTLSAKDGVGNQSERLPIPMTNQTFFVHADDLMLMLDGKDITDKVVPAAKASGTLSVGVMADGKVITLNDDSAVMTYGIEYTVQAMEGTASISGQTLTAGGDVNGLVTANVDGLLLGAVLGGNEDGSGGSGGSGFNRFDKTDVSVSDFVDVAEDTYYYDAVAWAVKNGITKGTSDTTFSPEWTCTRAEAVTFLWRAAGEPRAFGENPFTDVDEDAYYYKAMTWAVQKGITKGTSDTTFSPDMICSRSQIVTLLYRMAGEPTKVGGDGFDDVTIESYYHIPVLWAVGQEITLGTGNNAFSPYANCSRGQIVTFLYRYLG